MDELAVAATHVAPEVAPEPAAEIADTPAADLITEGAAYEPAADEGHLERTAVLDSVDELLVEAFAGIDDSAAEWNEILAALDPDDEDYAENVSDLIAARDADLVERVGEGITEVVQPLYEHAAAEQARVQHEQAIEDAHDLLNQLAEREDLDFDNDAVLRRAAELWPAMAAEHGDTEEVAQATTVHAARELGQQNAEAEAQYTPEQEEFFKHGEAYLNQPGGDEIAYAQRFSLAVAAGKEDPTLFPDAERPTDHASADAESYWTRGRNDELAVAFNFGRNQTEGN